MIVKLHNYCHVVCLKIVEQCELTGLLSPTYLIDLPSKLSTTNNVGYCYT